MGKKIQGINGQSSDRQKKMKGKCAEETLESLAYDHTGTLPGQVLEAGGPTLRSNKFFERKKEKQREARKKREKEHRKEEQQRRIRLKTELGNPEAFRFEMMRSKPSEFDSPKKKKHTPKKKRQTHINAGHIYHEVLHLKKEIESLTTSLVIRSAHASDVNSKIEETRLQLETKKNKVKQLEMKITQRQQSQAKKAKKGRIYHEVLHLKEEIESLTTTLVICNALASDVTSKIEETCLQLETKQNKLKQLEMKITQRQQSQAKKAKKGKGPFERKR